MLVAVDGGEQGGPHRRQAAVGGGDGEEVEQGGGGRTRGRRGRPASGAGRRAADGGRRAAPHLDRDAGPRTRLGTARPVVAEAAGGGGQPGRRLVAGELDHRLLPEGPSARAGWPGRAAAPGRRPGSAGRAGTPSGRRPAGEVRLPGKPAAGPGEDPGEGRPDPGRYLLEASAPPGGRRPGRARGRSPGPSRPPGRRRPRHPRWPDPSLEHLAGAAALDLGG